MAYFKDNLEFFGVWFVVIGVFAIPAVLLTGRCRKLIWWDWVFPFSGVAYWIFFSLIPAGSKVTLSNYVIELLAVALVSIGTPWLRLFLCRFSKKDSSNLVMLLTFAPLLAAFFLRLLMPSLPE